MSKLFIFLDSFQDPIVINGVTKLQHGIVHGEKVIKFEYRSNTAGMIRKGIFFIDKITGYTLSDMDSENQETNEPIIGGN